MTKYEAQLLKNEAQRAKLFSRLKRTINALDKLERQRKRIKITMQALAEDQGVPSKPNPFPVDANPKDPEYSALPDLVEAVDKALDNVSHGKPADDGLDIPPSLNRLNAMADPRDKEKKAIRRQVEKEKVQAELTGKTRKMPLTGKAALAAIKG